MNPQNEKRSIARKKRDPELRLAIFFICFACLIVLMTAFLVIRSLLPPPVPKDPSTESQTDPNPVDPTPFVPVFSGGSIGTMPNATDATVTLSTELSSNYGVLIDAESGLILAEKGSDTRFNPASMTKIMTLIVLCENFSVSDLEQEIMMTAEMREYVTTGIYQDSQVCGYKVGDKIKLSDLLFGIGVESDADCTMLAVNALFPDDTPAGAEQKFVALMQQKTTEMGLANTHFDNVIGHEGETNYSTARDIAAILMYALDSPLIREILSTEHHTHYTYRLEPDGVTYARWTLHYYSSLFNNKRKGGESSRIYAYERDYKTPFSLKNGAALLGGKTGTLGSGTEKDPYIFSLISFVEKNGRLYIAVTGEVTKSADVMKDAKTLYDNYLP